MCIATENMKKKAVEAKLIEIAKELLEQGKYSYEEISSITRLSMDIIKVLANPNGGIGKMGDYIKGEKLYEEADRLIDYGRAEGREEGGYQMIYSLVQDKVISPEVGANKLGITVEQLKANMINMDYSFPE